MSRQTFGISGASRQGGDEHEPLFTWGPSAFDHLQHEAPKERHSWNADETTRPGLLGRFDDWWYSLAPHKRREYKRYALGGAIMAVFLSLLIVVVALSPKAQGHKSPTPSPNGNLGPGQGTDQGKPAPAPNPTPEPVPKPAPVPVPVPAPRPSPSPPPPPPPVFAPRPTRIFPAPGDPQFAARPPRPPSPRRSPTPPRFYPPPIPPPPPKRLSPPPFAPDAAPQAQLEELCSWDSYYLPDRVVPVHYDLFLDVRLQTLYDPKLPADTNRVEGTVKTRIRVMQATHCVVLHADPTVMQITSAAYRPPNTQGESDLPAIDIMVDNERQMMLARFPYPVPASTSVVPGQPPPAMTRDGAPDEAQLGQLVISFKYNLTTGLDGFYLSTYVEPDEPSATYLMASTQFESIAARKAFPCFDEPKYKARFQLSMLAPTELTVLTNMPIVYKGPVGADGRSSRQAQVSPPMSTYLMAWVVGNLAKTSHPGCITNTGGSGVSFTTVPIAAYATPSKAMLLGNALEAACRAVQRYTRVLGVAYALPKLDLVAIPEFEAGAMENWGLITYQETYLLSRSDEDDVHQAVNVGTIVAHEIAHQWFGNLVTCADWGELWLNEGFATYFENLGADAWRPDYGFLQNFFLTGATLPALIDDSVNSSHPLSSLTRVRQASEIDNYFDMISYQKGGAVLRMLRMYTAIAVSGGRAFTQPNLPMGNTVPAAGTATPTPFTASNISSLPLRRRMLGQESTHERDLQQDDPGPLYLRPTWRDEPMFAGLKTYLETYAYGVATADKLWSVLSNTTSLPIKDWMSSWTYDRNYPVVHVEGITYSVDRSSIPAAGGRGQLQAVAQVQVRQAPILSGQGTGCGAPTPGGLKSPSGTPMVGQWWIPITAAPYTVRPTQVQVMTMQDCRATLTVPLGTEPMGAPILLNVGRYGFYRVNYTDLGWFELAEFADRPNVIPSMDMAGLLSDAYRLNERGQLSMKPFLDLLSQLGNRSVVEYAPWAVALSKLNSIRLKLSIAAFESDDPTTLNTCVSKLDKLINQRITAPLIQNLKINFTVGPQDSVQLRMLRPMVLLAAGKAGSLVVNTAADAEMSKVAGATGNVAASGVHPDVRDTLYCLSQTLENTDRTEAEGFEALKSIWLQERSTIEKSRLLYALTCAKGFTNAIQMMELLCTPAVRLQDVGSVMATLATQSGESFTAVWSFLTDPQGFAKLISRWPSKQAATYSLGLAIKQIATHFVADNYYTEVEAFFNANTALLDPTFMAWYKDHTYTNADWMEREVPGLCQYLAQLE